MADQNDLDLEIMDEIPQSVLIEYLRLQNRLAFLKDSIRASLERGAIVEKGDVTAKIQVSSRRSPKWKDELQKIVGVDKIKEITEATPASEVVSLKVDVNKQAIVQKGELS